MLENINWYRNKHHGGMLAGNAVGGMANLHRPVNDLAKPLDHRPPKGTVSLALNR